MTFAQLFSGQFTSNQMWSLIIDFFMIAVPAVACFYAGRMKGVNEGIKECEPIMDLYDSIIMAITDNMKDFTSHEELAAACEKLRTTIIDLKGRLHEINSKKHN